MEALESGGVATIEKPRLLPNETLRKLFFSQTMELGKLRKQISDPQNTEDLFNWYCARSDRFKKLKGEVKERTENFFGQEMISKEEVERRVCGRIFQDLSFVHFALTQPESQVLLSHKRTLEFFKAIFPEVNIGKHPFEQDSLWIFVPDGVIVKADKKAGFVISQVLEYSMVRVKGGRTRIFEEKSSSFDQQKIDLKAYEFFADANLRFIVPKVDKGSGLTRINKMFDVEQSPFSRSEIHEFMENNLPEAMKAFPIRNNSAVGTAA